MLSPNKELMTRAIRVRVITTWKKLVYTMTILRGVALLAQTPRSGEAELLRLDGATVAIGQRLPSGAEAQMVHEHYVMLVVSTTPN